MKFLTYRLINFPKWTIIFSAKIAMKFEPSKLSKIIEQNYLHLMPDFFEMQTEYLASLNIIYHDLDASLVAMVLTSQLYKNTVEENNSKEKISLKYFYRRENFMLPKTAFKPQCLRLVARTPKKTIKHTYKNPLYIPYIGS